MGDVTDVIQSISKTLKKKNLNLEKSNKQKISKWWQQIQKMEKETIIELYK